MALPALTREQQHAAINNAHRVRRERAALLADLKSGRAALADVLGRDDDLVRRTRVGALLRALPGVGAVKANAILAAAGIAESRRVASVGPHQRQRLLDGTDTLSTRTR